MPTGAARSRRPSIRLRLTLAGWAFLGTTALVAVVAINSRLALVLILFGGMMGALYVSMVLSRRMVWVLQVRRAPPPRARQFEPVRLEYVLRSPQGGGSSLALRVEELPAGRHAAPPACCPHLPSRQAARAACRLIPQRRGRIRLEALKVSTVFPFGLVAASRRFEQAGSLIVWPARGRLRGSLLAEGAVESSPAGPSLAAGGQDEFYGVREYRAGDNPRWIHWRRSAGRPEPVVREMSRPRPLTLWVVMDTHLGDGTPAARAARERTIRFVATLLEDALWRGHPAGLILAYADGPAVIRPSDRLGQRDRLLDALADVDDNVAWTLERTMAALRPQRLREGRLVVVGRQGAAQGWLRRAGRSGAGGNVSLVDVEGLSDLYVDCPAAEDAPCP